jgi:hypothetical protein
MKPENQQPKALKAKAWKLMSELVRRKHADKDGYAPCFTCGRVQHWTEQDAGHGIGGRDGFVLFLEEIIKNQCKSCNGYQGGRYEIFIPKLEDLYGKDQFKEWANNARKPYKRTKMDYVELVYELQGRLKELEEEI